MVVLYKLDMAKAEDEDARVEGRLSGCPRWYEIFAGSEHEVKRM